MRNGRRMRALFHCTEWHLGATKVGRGLRSTSRGRIVASRFLYEPPNLQRDCLVV